MLEINQAVSSNINVTGNIESKCDVEVIVINMTEFSTFSQRIVMIANDSVIECFDAVVEKHIGKINRENGTIADSTRKRYTRLDNPDLTIVAKKLRESSDAKLVVVIVLTHGGEGHVAVGHGILCNYELHHILKNTKNVVFLTIACYGGSMAEEDSSSCKFYSIDDVIN